MVRDAAAVDCWCDRVCADRWVRCPCPTFHTKRHYVGMNEHVKRLLNQFTEQFSAAPSPVLDRAGDALPKYNEMPRTCCVLGMAGVGKTSTAKEYVRVRARVCVIGRWQLTANVLSLPDL